MAGTIHQSLPAGVARYDYNADGTCIFFNADGSPRPKPAASDLCGGPGRALHVDPRLIPA